MAFHFNRLSGTEGKVTIRGLGSVVGEIANWTLTRRGEEGPHAGTFDLRVVFSFLVPALMLDPDYNEDREIVMTVSKGRAFRLKLDAPERMALQGKVLFMEGVENPEWART